MEKMLIRGVTKDTNVARISVVAVPDIPGIAFKVFTVLAQKNINVDIIIQSLGRDGTKDITFTCAKDNADTAIEAIRKSIAELADNKIDVDTSVAKVSIVGAGMESHPGTAAAMFEALYEISCNIKMIATSEIKISVLIDDAMADKAVAAIHSKFFD